MKHSIRILTLVMLSIILTIVMPVSAQDNPVTLTLWTVQGTDSPDIFDKIAADYMAAHPNVTVNIERRVNDAYKEALRLAINTSASPDGYFSWGGIGLGGFYVRSGGALPIEKYYEQYGWADRFTKASLSATYFDGKQYGIPFRIRAMGLYYSKAAFSKAGITAAPTTYDELIAANDKLVAAGITPLGMGGRFGWMLMRLTDSLLEMTCKPETHDGLRALKLDWSKEPCVTAAYTELKRWADNGYLPKDFLSVDPSDVWATIYQGKAAMAYDGDWQVDGIKTDGMNIDDYDFFVFPTSTDRIAFFTEMFFVTSTTKNPDEMAKFYDFWTSKDTQTKYAGQFGTIWPTLGIERPADALPIAQKWSDTVASYSGTYGPADQQLPLELFGSYSRIQADVVSGVVKPEEAGAQMQRDITTYKANNPS
ncbi:MAG: extracellular solute-binding protein [Anaerolineae bacterium]|nr:extracellular solute-binding protein [Anaerolineae bacterium]